VVSALSSRLTPYNIDILPDLLRISLKEGFKSYNQKIISEILMSYLRFKLVKAYNLKEIYIIFINEYHVF
jgi:hypothetical protein